MINVCFSLFKYTIKFLPANLSSRVNFQNFYYLHKKIKSVKFLSVLLLVPLFMSPAFGAVAPTDGGSLDVDFSYPDKVMAGEEIKMDIDFINPTTQKTQIHIDYFVTVLEEGSEIFGPTNRIHTSEGKISVPIQFQRDGQYEVKIDIDGILFNAIPTETVSFPLIVGDVAASQDPLQTNTDDNGCLIATAAFGTELSEEVQMLREIRDNSLLATESGSAFMNSFNQFYYLFSPTIADWQRQNPAFNEAVKITITPLLSTLAILNYAGMDSEEKVLGYGIGVIALNLGIYLGLPVAGILKLYQIRRN